MPYEISDLRAVQDEQAQKPAIIRAVPLVGGVNNRYAPQDIPEGQAAELQNCDLDDQTRPSLRDGYSLIASLTTGLSATNVRPSGLAYLNCNALANRALVMALTGSRLYRTTDTTSPWVAVTPDLDVSDTDVVMFQASDSLYIVSQDTALEVQQMAPAGTLTAGGDTNTSPPKGAVDGCYFLNRAWLLKAGAPPELHYSKLVPGTASIASDWNRDGVSASSATAGRLRISPNIGSQPRAVRPWNAISLIVWFDASVEEVLVDSTDPQANSIRRVLEPRYGTSARDTCVIVGQEAFFLDQYGSFRSLQQTVNAAQAGIVPKPLSEAIRNEIPGNINQASLSKCFVVVNEDKLYLFYPRGASLECNAYFTYDLARQERPWAGPNLLSRPVFKGISSNIRQGGGAGWEMFVSDGGASPLSPLSYIYRMFPGTYTDNGTGYYYSETTRAYDFGSPETDKLPVSLELEATGEQGAMMAADVQVDENGLWQQLPGTLSIPVTAADDFPLTSASFPLLPGSFPLVTSNPGLVRKVWRLRDLTRYGRGRFYKFRFRSVSTGLLIRRVSYRVTAHVQPRPVMT